MSLLVLAGCDRVFGLAERDPALPADASVADPIRWYKLDTLESGRVVDEAANGHDGQCTAPACPTAAIGVVDGALRFDGETQLVRAPSDLALEAPGNFTVAVWTYVERTTIYGCVVSKLLGTGIENSWQLCRGANGQWDFNTPGNRLSAPESTPLGGWHHVAIRWNGVTKSISVDAVVSATATGEITYDGGDLVIGGDVDDGAPAVLFPGVLDDLRIYNRALSDGELLELAALPARPTPPR